jgi:hypothetical protein
MAVDHDEIRVWLDDDVQSSRRIAPDGWIQAVTAWQANELLDSGRVVELSLDHDLGDDAAFGRGVDVVQFIVDQQMMHARDLWPRDGITLHTANAQGRDTMQLQILRYATLLHPDTRVRVVSGHRHIAIR